MYPVVFHLEAAEHTEPLVTMLRSLCFVGALVSLYEPGDALLVFRCIEPVALLRCGLSDVAYCAIKYVLRSVDFAVNVVNFLV